MKSSTNRILNQRKGPSKFSKKRMARVPGGRVSPLCKRRNNAVVSVSLRHRFLQGKAALSKPCLGLMHDNEAARYLDFCSALVQIVP